MTRATDSTEGPRLGRRERSGVSFITDASRPHGVTLAFTERAGGVSEGAFASLNLGDRCGDDPAAVAENRRRAAFALAAEAGVPAGEADAVAARLVNPRQVHGDHLVTITSADAPAIEAARAEAAAGADGIVCTAADVPVLLCFADCVPVVLAAPGGFAVLHSGWRGTIARIAATGARALMDVTGASPEEVRAWIGPHIAGADYEVSRELLDRFVGEFGPAVDAGERHLDLEAAIRIALGDAGIRAAQVASVPDSTARATDRFYSYRASGGSCGRHGALALMHHVS